MAKTLPEQWADARIEQIRRISPQLADRLHTHLYAQCPVVLQRNEWLMIIGLLEGIIDMVPTVEEQELLAKTLKNLRGQAGLEDLNDVT